jgi:hypothetical protein
MMRYTERYYEVTGEEENYRKQICSNNHAALISIRVTAVFDASLWERYGLKVKEPKIPQRFFDALEAPCPF